MMHLARPTPVFGAIAALSLAQLANAQPAHTQTTARTNGTPATASAPTNTSTIEGNALVLQMVQMALVALHQANQTGNYTVLRDLSAPGFRDKNSAADLAEIFAPIRKQTIDLSTALSSPPQITRSSLENQHMLFIAGTLKSLPVPVKFEMLFQPFAGTWRLYGIAVIPEQVAQRGTPQGR